MSVRVQSSHVKSEVSLKAAELFRPYGDSRNFIILVFWQYFNIFLQERTKILGKKTLDENILMPSSVAKDSLYGMLEQALAQFGPCLHFSHFPSVLSLVKTV